MYQIQLESVRKYFGIGKNRLEVLKGVSAGIKKGEIVSIVGPSGAGKSTMMNLIGGLDHFQEGSIIINGKNISQMSISELSTFRNRNLGFIFQSNNLMPEFTALENIMIPLLIRRADPAKARERALDLLDRFSLLDRRSHKPSELSGGECQRITVARALAGNPEIILADEPTGSLDRKNSDNLIEFLFTLGKERGNTIIIVTHDQSIADRTERTIRLIDGNITEDQLNRRES